MLKLDEHPSVIKFWGKKDSEIETAKTKKLEAEWLRELCLSTGADDVGFVEIDRKEIADQRADILADIPNTESIIVLSFRLNRQNIRTPARSITNFEFQETGKHLKEVLRKVVATLEQKGMRAVCESGLFPMELDRLPAKAWLASLKPLAIAAGLGGLGRHRLIIHPKFGAFMYLGAVFIDREISAYSRPIDYNPCIECRLCTAVCPSGDEVIGPFLLDRKDFLNTIVKPLQKKEEKIYVIPGSDAEIHVSNRFPHKTIRRVGNGLRPTSIKGFLTALPLIFQRGQSTGLNVIYHFTFRGKEAVDVTVTIKDKKIEIIEGHVGRADIHVKAESETWLKFLAKETNIVWALLQRKIRLKGSPKLLIAFGKCFPS